MANAAFMGIGAYTAALLTMNHDAPFALALAGGMAALALAAFAIGKPTLRLSGVYPAMATLAFGEVVRIAILNTESLTGARRPQRHPARDPVVACRAGAGLGAVRPLAPEPLARRSRLRGDQGRHRRRPDGHRRRGPQAAGLRARRAMIAGLAGRSTRI